MRTVVLGDRPAELQDWLERRQALGQDRFDEVWGGEYHVAPWLTAGTAESTTCWPNSSGRQPAPLGSTAAGR